MWKIKKEKKSFTLIELIVVVAIIGILAASLTPQLVGTQDKARKARAQSDIEAINTALILYIDDNAGNYPGGNSRWAQNGDWLNQYLAGAGGVKRYLAKAITNDPWGTPYRFFSCANYATGHAFVMSRGLNRGCDNGGSYRWGTTPQGDDIVMWIR